jgi:ADP-heptose:LPS heptosyltransferase
MCCPSSEAAVSLNVSPDEVRKIAVLRPNAVGDFVFALPALHALKQRYPDADIVLLGKDWHAGFLRDRPGPVDRVAVMPPVPGVGAPVGAICDEREIDRFVDAMRAERFDIALQMFGAGHYSNPFLLRLGARLTAGARADGAPALERWVPYCEPNNRRLGRGRGRSCPCLRCLRCLRCRN